MDVVAGKKCITLMTQWFKVVGTSNLQPEGQFIALDLWDGSKAQWFLATTTTKKSMVSCNQSTMLLPCVVYAM